ncbi:UNVERIFIED_CONTAM: hypothetical protein K2H54_004142 [Gekko kuhli]
MRVRWEPIGGATGYLLLYDAVNATVPTTEKEMRVGASVNDVHLVDLIPNTEYTLTIHGTFGDLTSDPLTTQEVTLPLSGARSLRARDITHSSMRVYWEAASGKVRKYIVKYKAGEDDDVKEVEVDSSQTSTVLSDLFSQTLYQVELIAAYDEGLSVPIATEATTYVHLNSFFEDNLMERLGDQVGISILFLPVYYYQLPNLMRQEDG